MNRWTLVATGCCVAAALCLSGCDIGGGGGKGAGTEATFANPIMNGGADPWVIKHDGYYYYTHTVGNAIQIWKSRSLTDMAGAESAVVWQPPADGPNSKEIWAPELHWLNGKWYIYYAADDGLNDNHRMFVLESATDDALGQYEDKGKIADPTDKWAIDGTVLSKSDGSLYFIWSGWEGDVNVDQRLYIAPMSNPYTISGDRVEISKPELDWETVGEPTVNEGPEVLVSDKKINIVYSASGSWTDDYTLGLLSADPDSDLLNPASWAKKPEAVFAKTDRVFGPGHCSFVKSPDDKEDWIVYHAAVTSGAGWNRNVRAQPFTWNDDGTPNFGEPVSPGTFIPLPSGESKRIRLEAEDAKLDGLQVIDQEEASGGKVIGGSTGGEGSVEWEINAKEDGVYRLALRYLNETSVPQTLNMTIGGKLHVKVTLDTGLKGEWSNAFIPVGLKEGSNSIALSGVNAKLSLDSIDVLGPEDSADDAK